MSYDFVHMLRDVFGRDLAVLLEQLSCLVSFILAPAERSACAKAAKVGSSQV